MDIQVVPLRAKAIFDRFYECRERALTPLAYKLPIGKSYYNFNSGIFEESRSLQRNGSLLEHHIIFRDFGEVLGFEETVVAVSMRERRTLVWRNAALHKETGEFTVIADECHT